MPPPPPPPSATLVATPTLLFALTAFATNSILCRLALANGEVDAATFTLARLVSGALCLLLVTGIVRRRTGAAAACRPDPLAAALLFAYALAFSLAYRDLAAGTGALILFATVQATMIGWGLCRGERLRTVGWAGLVLALGGLAWLNAPGLAAPSPGGALLMATAGLAWGGYSLRGRGQTAPLAATTSNFALATLPALLVALLAPGGRVATSAGVGLAVLSGAVASGLGYVAWCAALRTLRATSAATVQLVVPVLAAVGGVVLLGEVVTLRLVASAVLIVGGVWLTLVASDRRRG